MNTIHKNEHSSRKLLDYFVAHLDYDLTAQQNYEIFKDFLTHLKIYKKELDVNNFLSLYKEQSNKVKKALSIGEAISFLVESNLLNENEIVGTIVNWNKFTDIIKIEYGDGVSFSFKNEINTKLDISAVNEIMSSIFGDNVSEGDSENTGFIGLMKFYGFIPLNLMLGDNPIIEILIKDISNESLRKSLIPNLKSTGYGKIVLSIVTVEDYNLCLDKLSKTSDELIQNALNEIGVGSINSEISDESEFGKAFYSLIAEGIDMGCSDIHIAPGPNLKLEVNYRIDGDIVKLKELPIEFLSKMEIKILNKAKATVSAVPDEGLDISFNDELENLGKKYNFKNRCNLSKIIGIDGHSYTKIVMRISSLYKYEKKGPTDLLTLGLNEKQVGDLNKMFSKPNGIILVTGPTGSGKTNTLYASFENMIATDNKKIYITIEDPVERPLPGAYQHQINDKAGYSFNKAIRSLLREDLDICLIGELRDPETAEIAFDVAGTGHLVFSTLHTNTAVQSIARMRTLGVLDYQISSFLVGIVSQRLVSKPCPNCSKKTLGSELNSFLEKRLGKSYNKIKFKFNENSEYFIEKGKGCDYCNNRGVIGRIGIFEILYIDVGFKNFLENGPSTGEIYNYIWNRNAELSENEDRLFVSMLEDGLIKVSQGLACYNEVIPYEDTLG